MSKTYIELASGYRDRLLNPNVADFVSNPAELNAENPLENSNNIAHAYPFYNFWSLPLNIIKRWDCNPKTQTVTFTSVSVAPDTPTDTCPPTIVIDQFGNEAILLSEPPPSPTSIAVSVGCGVKGFGWDGTAYSTGFTFSISPNDTTPYTGASVTSPTPLPAEADDSENYPPELNPMNYGLDVCNMHLTTKNMDNPSNSLAAPSNLTNSLSSCCVGTAGRPTFSNTVVPIQTVSNMYNYKIEIEKCGVITSLYNSYATTGLLQKISNQCCFSQYFDGMTLTNFTSDSKTTLQNCNECSVIAGSTDAATLPTNRCCDIIIPVQNLAHTGTKLDPCSAYSTYFSIETSAVPASNVGCIAACPITDSIAFDVSPYFSAPYRCVDWWGKSECWDQIKCEKAQYNPSVINNDSWNCIRIQGGGPYDANNSYCCSLLEMIPVPIDAYTNFPKALPGGLSDRFKVISSYNSSSKLASFAAHDCCNSVVQKQWQRMMYWMLSARCRRSMSTLPYNPDGKCDKDLLTRLANGSPPAGFEKKDGCTDDGGAIKTYTIAGSITVLNGTILAATNIPATGGCGCGATFEWPVQATGTAVEAASIRNVGSGYKVGDTLHIPITAATTSPNTPTAPVIGGKGLTITIKAVTPTISWPDIGLPAEGTNYLWNYRMRKELPELIATSNPGNIETTLTYDTPQEPSVVTTSSLNYAETSPPLFLYGVPFEVELLAGGSGYSRGGRFIFGFNNCDLFEIQFIVSCGEVIDVKLSKLAIDRDIYTKFGGVETPLGSGVYKVTKCDVGSQSHYFNTMIPDILELNKLGGSGDQYTYNWDGQMNSKRKQREWFGGSGACIRIKKGYGFFSNIGNTEKTNYACKTGNSRSGPINNDQTGCMLFLPSVAEACTNNFGELRNSLNFSTFSQTNNRYKSKFHTPLEPDGNTYNLKYQYDSNMKFFKQYPKVMSKSVGCTYNYATPPFDSDSTGTTPIIANFSTQDIPIYWSHPVAGAVDWEKCRFNDLVANKQSDPIDGTQQQLVQASVLITKNAFPGFPLNIDGTWNITAGQAPLSSATTPTGPGGSFLGWDRDIPKTASGTKTIPSQCCAYEWEILGVSSPSVMPLNNQLIPKSSTQEPSCWRVNLRNLVLPNTTLQSGSLASFYPYFYVEFSNVTEIGRQHQMVQSNNPNSKPALFRCAVTDIATPTISRFIKLTGDGMYQTVKFRPNDSLKIKVFLPDGREFMPTIPDNAPPSAPNPLVQISALFEVEHIE